MGSMMADLAGIHSTINNIRKKKGEPELSTDDMLINLFNEVEYVWPRVGYPPLVTPFYSLLASRFQQMHGHIKKKSEFTSSKTAFAPISLGHHAIDQRAKNNFFCVFILPE